MIPLKLHLLDELHRFSLLRLLADGSIGDVFVFVDNLELDPESGGLVLPDTSNDIVRGLGGVVVTGELCTFVEDWHENSRGEIILASFPDIL